MFPYESVILKLRISLANPFDFFELSDNVLAGIVDKFVFDVKRKG